jgi:hypothetical protein
MDDLDEYDNKETDFIKKLQNASKEDMMEIIYKSIIEKSMGALNHDAPASVKIEGVQIVLDFFKDREEYEKCTELKKIIDKLSC